MMNGNKGLNVIVDTKKVLERYARMPTKKGWKFRIGEMERFHICIFMILGNLLQCQIQAIIMQL
jgi:hypothetical protein